MKLTTTILLLLLVALSCKPASKKEIKISMSTEVIATKSYELHQVPNSNQTLILFPGGGATSKETKAAFEILPSAIENNISVLFMNFNRHLWIDEIEAKLLSQELESIFAQNNLNSQNVTIGGMSIGGNIALTLSNYLAQSNSPIISKGVFIIDSPIDLNALYENSLNDLANPDFDEARLAEPNWIINYFKNEFGEDSMLTNIQEVSPFTRRSNFINIPALKNTNIRFYTEPDSIWWWQNRQTKFEFTNAYMIQQITKQLKAADWDKLELIETTNKGYRANQERHPHSWSIVDVDELIVWMNQ